MNGDDARPVRASDISVLVRSRQEAAQVRDALTLLEILPFTFRTATVF